MQDKLMKFDPAQGNGKPHPSHAAQWREYHGTKAWLYNPWTGAKRTPEDIGDDCFGKLIDDGSGKAVPKAKPGSFDQVFTVNVKDVDKLHGYIRGYTPNPTAKYLWGDTYKPEFTEKQRQADWDHLRTALDTITRMKKGVEFKVLPEVTTPEIAKFISESGFYHPLKNNK